MAIAAQRLFGVKCAGTFAQANASVTAPDGTVNIIATDTIYFLNGVNNVQPASNGSLEIDYTLFAVGTAVAPVIPGTAPGFFWLEFS